MNHDYLSFQWPYILLGYFPAVYNDPEIVPRYSHPGNSKWLLQMEKCKPRVNGYNPDQVVVPVTNGRNEYIYTLLIAL
jgi:hypothetical protein